MMFTATFYDFNIVNKEAKHNYLNDYGSIS